MKIVQSYWTKPSEKKKSINILDRSKGGWSDKKYNFMSWALSALQFRKYYDELELVTDEAGRKLLVDQLALPYTSVKVVLDNLNGYHADLWALGKIYAYSVQETPFLHADGDIYIWEKFPADVENARLVVQNLEISHNYYDVPYAKMRSNFNFIPNVITKSVNGNKEIRSINAGIIGGSDISMFKEYTSLAFEFVDRNYDDLSKIEIGSFNCFFEQVLFYAMSEDRKIPIKYFLENVNYAFDGLVEFAEAPAKKKYIHTVGGAKQNESIGIHVARRLQIEYPDHYYHIQNLLNTYQI